MLSLDERGQVAIQRTGLAEVEVEKLPFDLSKLEDDGILVDVDCAGFSRLTAQLDWNTLGVDLPPKAKNQVRAPLMLTLPRAKAKGFYSAADAARYALMQYGFRFSLVEVVLGTPSYRWVPWTAWTVFENAFKHANDMLDAARADCIANYDAIRLEVTQMLEELAAKSAKSLRAAGVKLEPSFEAGVVATGLSKMPSIGELQHSFRLRYRVGILQLGSEMLEEQHKAAAARDKAHDERVEAAEEAEVKAKIRQVKLAAAKELAEQSLAPVREGILQVHTAIYEEVTELLKTAGKHDYLPGSTTRRVANVAAWVRSMNTALFNDAELDGLIAKLEDLAKNPGVGVKRDMAAVTLALNEVKAYTAQAAAEAKKMGRFATLEI